MTESDRHCVSILRRIWRAHKNGKGVRLSHDEIGSMIIGPWADPTPDADFKFEAEYGLNADNPTGLPGWED